MQEIGLDKVIINKATFTITYTSLKNCLQSVDFFNKMLSGLTIPNLKNILVLIAKKLEFREVAPEEIVYSKGDTKRDIYFVVSGEIGAFIIVNNVLREIRTFYEEEGFGDAEAVAQINRLFATIAKKQSILAILKPEDFSDVLKDYNSKVYLSKFSKFMQNYILSGFSKSHLELIVHNTKQIRAQRNQIIYSYGDPSEEIYFIDSGQIKLYREVGRKQIEICVLEQGQLLGEVEFILEHPRSSTAKCLSESVVMYKISRKLFYSQASPYALRGVYQLVETKEKQRQQRFDQICEKRIQVENPEVRFERITKMLDKGRKLANKRYSQLDDGKVYGTAEETNFSRRVDCLVNKKNKVLQQGYGLQVKKHQIEKHQFFDFAKGLRPRVLHYHSNRIKSTKRKFPTETGSNDDSQSINIQIKSISRLFDKEHSYLQLKKQVQSPPRLPTLKKRRLLKELSFELF